MTEKPRHCEKEMRLIFKIEDGNCDEGCCPSYLMVYQCDLCKFIESP